MAGDKTQKNTSPQTTDIIAHNLRQVPVLCAKYAGPGEVILLLGLGVEALNQDALPPPRCYHHLAHHYLPTPLWWGVTCLPPIKEVLPQSDSMHLPRRIATLLVTTYKLVMVTMLQLHTSCSYHMLIVWYWSEMGDEFQKLYNLQKIFDFLGLGSKCVDIMSCHGYGPVDTGMSNLLRSRRLMNGDDQTPPCLDGQDRPSERNTLQDTPSGSS